MVTDWVAIELDERELDRELERELELATDDILELDVTIELDLEDKVTALLTGDVIEEFAATEVGVLLMVMLLEGPFDMGSGSG